MSAQTGEIFAAIDVGSYELAMKVFAFSKKKGVTELDHVAHSIDLGTETYATGHIASHHVRELAQSLKEMKSVMKSYDVTTCLAYATSAFRETNDVDIVRNFLRTETGIEVEVLSNSEQRFLNYKAVALRGEEFREVIEKPTAFLDLGGGSLQLSVFDNDKLIATQNMMLGVLRLKQTLDGLDASPRTMRHMIGELADTQIRGFQKMYLRDRRIRNLIVVDDYLSPILRHKRIGSLENGHTTCADFDAFLTRSEGEPRLKVASDLGIPVERLPVVEIAAFLIAHIASELAAEALWAPGVTLCDGIAYDYAERKKYLQASHDFERDIIACAQNMSRRYMGSKKHTEAVSELALNIFDAMKKHHGLGRRERLLLQIAALLNDCGKYISMLNISESSYHIIMSTEMIGLSHREREIVANVVRLAHKLEDGLPKAKWRSINLNHEDNLTIAKLTAMLRVARALDRTASLKFKEVKVRLKDRELILAVDKEVDASVERGMLAQNAVLFTEVFGVTPRITQKAGNKGGE